MSKLAVAIGCCLLLAAPAGCARQATPAATAATTGVQGTMEQTNARIAEAAARAHDWQPADVVVTPLDGGSAGGCRLFGVRSGNVLSAITHTYAVIDGTAIVTRGDPDALARVLEACGDDADAAAWAYAIAAFHPGHPPGRVAFSERDISSVAHKWAVADGGYSFHPPRFEADGTVAFFMSDVEGNQLFAVRGARSAGGAVEVTVRPAGKN